MDEIEVKETNTGFGDLSNCEGVLDDLGVDHPIHNPTTHGQSHSWFQGGCCNGREECED
jgi:hypothetical protein